jgi:hypothetical protein
MMEPRLAIALAIHEGACRILAERPILTATDAIKKSFEVMRQIIPNLDEISFDLEELLRTPKERLAAERTNAMAHAMKHPGEVS